MSTLHHPQAQQLIQALRDSGPDRPALGSRRGAAALLELLPGLMPAESARHAPSLLCALGALAGQACQASLRAQAQEGGAADSVLRVVRTADGRRYFVGGPLNDQLTGRHISLWRLAGGDALPADAPGAPDLDALYRHVADTLGTPAFGVPRVPPEHVARALPIDYLRVLWPAALSTVRLFCAHPVQWAALYGWAIRQTLEEGAGGIDTPQALRIVMESAVPMSRVDLEGG